MANWDEMWLFWLAQLSATNPYTFFASLLFSDRVPLTICVVVLIALWFTGTTADDTQRPGQCSREECRLRVLLIFISAVAALMFSRMLGVLFYRPRPLVNIELQAPIDPIAWADMVELFKHDGAFPSHYAAFWFAVTAGLFTYRWRAGLAAGLAGLVLGALRVAIGYHYPTDIIAAACLGILILSVLYSIRRKLIWLTHPTLQFFAHVPMLAYPLGLVLMIDVTQRMTWLFNLLVILTGTRMLQ